MMVWRGNVNVSCMNHVTVLRVDRRQVTDLVQQFRQFAFVCADVQNDEHSSGKFFRQPGGQRTQSLHPSNGGTDYDNGLRFRHR